MKTTVDIEKEGEFWNTSIYRNILQEVKKNIFASIVGRIPQKAIS